MECKKRINNDQKANICRTMLGPMRTMYYAVPIILQLQLGEKGTIKGVIIISFLMPHTD